MTSLPPPSALTPEEIQLYREVLDQGGVIQPNVDPVAAIGYAYPVITRFLGLGPDLDIQYLEHRERQNLLRRVFHDRVHLCPECSRAVVNFREVCPQCAFADIHAEDVVHHFRCAYVGSEETFRRGSELVCPKCQKHLRSVGKDFERPTDLQVCRSCKNLFAEPLVQGLCLKCGHRFPQEHRIVRDVHRFHLTAAVVPALRGEIWDTTLMPQIADELAGVVAQDFLLAWLEVEVQRARRYQHPLSLVLVGAELLGATDATRRRYETLAGLHRLARVLEKTRRKTDLIGRLSTGVLVFVLPETPLQGAEIMASRLSRTLGEVTGQESLQTAAVTLGVEDTADQFLERGAARLGPPGSR